MSWLILLVMLPVAFSKEKPYQGHRLISVQAATQEDLDFLVALWGNSEFDELDFWIVPSLSRPTDIQVPPQLYEPLQAAFNKAGKRFAIKQENLQAQVDAEADARSAAKALKLETASIVGCNHLQEYCTLGEIEFLMQNLAADFPERVSLSTIGQSYEGKEIYYLKIVEDVALEPKEAIWIEAATHAREWAAVACALHLMNQLARQETADAALMLSRYDWYIVPVHNPDGYVYTHESERLWRKNRQPCNKRMIGTDLNRNWDIAFGTVGTSKRCNGITYPGKKPFSAPETAALRDAIFATNNRIAFFSIHAYSEMLMVPWGYKYEHPAEYDTLIGIANKMVDGLSTVDGKRYSVGTPADLLYLASGSAADYMYQEGVPYSLTFEVRPNDTMGWGFLLPEFLINVTAWEVFKSLWAFANEYPPYFTPSK